MIVRKLREGAETSCDVECRHPKQRLPSNWFLAQLKPSGFSKAKLNLERQGFETFMPMREVEIRHARKTQRSTRPLFPGYIFVAFEPDRTEWRVINGTYGVQRLIIFTRDKPQAVPLDMMSDLFSRCGDNDMILPIEHFKKGDQVRVLSGPFADFVARVEQLSDRDGVALLLDMMGRSTRAVFVRKDLEIVPEA